MNDFGLIFDLFILIGLGVIYLTAKNLLPSYFSEKGKNIATKEDIEEITSLVESVKHSFTIETEKIKSNLQILAGLKGSFITEEINSIISFNETYFDWLNKLMDTGLGSADTKKESELDLYRKKISDAEMRCSNSEAKLLLFVENENLLKALNELRIATIKHIASLPQKYIIQIIFNNFQIQQAVNGSSAENIQSLYDKQKGFFKEFNDKTIEGYAIIIPLAKDFRKICRNHIQELMKNRS
ncbi:MAG: hypothetical protein WC150_06225 [Bacteroidia bacterium]